MNWLDFWNAKGTQVDNSQQVGRVIKGEAMQNEMLDKIAYKIATQLNLRQTDKLLDVCCGNGLLDQHLARYCTSITGVDFSKNLIEAANTRHINKATFHCSDAGSFVFEQKFEKALLYFSFQYFETDEMAFSVVKNLLRHIEPGGKLLLGDVTDKRKWFKYYNSPRKWLSWLKQRIQGKNDMGRFWHPKELSNLILRAALELNIDSEKLQIDLQSQETWQPYSHYRFDFLVTFNA